MPFLSILGSLFLSFMLIFIIKKNIKKSEIDDKKTNKDSLYYIGLVFTLCVSVNSFLYIIFSIIDKLIPDINNSSYYQAGMLSEVAMMIATTIIVFPLYILFSYLIDKDIKKDPAKKDLSIRKSAIYLALIVTTVMVISVIVLILYYFLMGSLLNVFLLKSLVVLLVSIFLFAYYYFSLDRDYKSSTKIPMILSIFALLIVFITIVYSIYIFGTPSKVRDLNTDNLKITDMSSISYRVSNYYQDNKNLPENLNMLGADYKNKETGLEYEYHTGTSSKYSLCDTFKTDTDYGNDYELSKWSHKKGYQCFDLDAIYKQY